MPSKNVYLVNGVTYEAWDKPPVTAAEGAAALGGLMAMAEAIRLNPNVQRSRSAVRNGLTTLYGAIEQYNSQKIDLVARLRKMDRRIQEQRKELAKLNVQILKERRLRCG